MKYYTLFDCVSYGTQEKEQQTWDGKWVFIRDIIQYLNKTSNEIQHFK